MFLFRSTRKSALVVRRMSGLIKCQFDSFLREFPTVVVKCVPISDGQRKNKNYEIPATATHSVTLEDTILFAVGGGQPSDHGTINAIPVVFVARDESGTVQVRNLWPRN
jgi:Ser-tRNA(Ala) deacylase AlaX